MTLRSYVKPRMVALNSTATALEAARAIENNNIGAVVVQDRGRITGIVTDRDLTVRVVGQGRDPQATKIADIMTQSPACLSPASSQTDAIRLMRERGVRRIPLIEDERIVGLVTLDDLFLDEAAPLEELSEVVHAQLGQGGPAPTATAGERAKAPREQRRASRAETTYARVIDQVQEATRLDREKAEIALERVLSSLVRRLTPDESKDLIAQLPSLLQPKLESRQTGPDRHITRESTEDKLVQRLDVSPERAAELLKAIGKVISENVSSGQMQDVRSQLPAEFREVFTSAAAPASH